MAHLMLVETPRHAILGDNIDTAGFKTGVASEGLFDLVLDADPLRRRLDHAG